MPDDITENDNRRIQLDVWLSQNRMSKKELAAKLGVTESAVYGWFSNTRIPEKRWQQMKGFFSSDSEPPASGCIAVDFTFTDTEWNDLTADLPDNCDKKEAVKQRLLAFIHAAHIGRR